MLESILSKTVLIVFSLALLVACSSVLSSFYSGEEENEADASLEQFARILCQVDAGCSEYTIRLEMREYLGADSLLRIGNGSILMFHDGQVSAADLAGGIRLKVLDETGSERTVIEVRQNDILTVERSYCDGSPVTVAYIENVDATFSTVPMNRSTSSTVL